MSKRYDAVVVGSGPNGLSAAITIARTGRSVIVFEAKDTIGGGARTRELTLPGFLHDVCSAIHPLALASPFLRSLPLATYGLEWIQPPAPLAHPLDDGTAVVLERSVEQTSATLGCDAVAYEKMVNPLVRHWNIIENAFLGPLRISSLVHPFVLAPFGLRAIRSARSVAETEFKGERARALFAGLAAHSMLPLNRPPSAAFGLMVGLPGHIAGWPFPRGGAQKITDAMAAYLHSLGGEVVTNFEVNSLDTLPEAQTTFLDVTPRQLLRIADNRLTGLYRQQLRHYRYGPGVFKVDFALDGPVPWKAEACLRAGTVHIGGTFAEIAASESACWKGIPPEKPFVIAAQQSLFDPTRAPAGKQTLWAYCHVPHGSTFDMTERIETQIERFAPGFRDRILARHTMSPFELEEYNANYIGGDINGGVQDFLQLFTRPAIRLVPYSTPDKHLYICSSSTPPGGGVHGMCGYFAASAALRRVF
ncbi:MAG TPA: NAD(P)/FAD-dependent oxidoreductase [Ktedonobacteraceae bacterium]|jgi:phytoene dehydrogenase-like protein|nr:NAD(P)/FAD-dependent oxidoreductase [Ktedonobacteraceae bacterium]